jgi:hypothetical protein
MSAQGASDWGLSPAVRDLNNGANLTVRGPHVFDRQIEELGPLQHSVDRYREEGQIS